MDINNITVIINNNGYEAEVKEVTKGSTRRTGIQVGNGRVRALIYPDNIQVEGSDEEIAMSIIKTYEDNKDPEFEFDDVTSIDYIKKNMKVALRRPVEDEAFAIDFLDMQAVIRVNVKSAKNLAASFIIKNDLAKQLGLTEEIFKDAIKNMDFKCMPMGSIVEDVLGVDKDMIPDVGMFVLSNDEKTFGAAALFDPIFIKSVAFFLDSDLMIIPSSIHELIAIKYDGSQSIADASDMVKEVNAMTVDPSEQLSDHVYLYKKDTGKFVW